MSMPPNAIKIDPNWKFTFTKNPENAVLLEFETHDGSRKAASPSFLMALLLKHHWKIIKKAIKEKPKSFGFYLFDEYENEAKENIQAQLKAACGLLNMEFIMVDFHETQ